MGFNLCFILGASPLFAADLAAIHSYDSSLAWMSQMDRILDEVVSQVVRFLKPVEGRITSGFGTREHPILGVVKHHNGLDIACATGSEVRSPLAGKVIFTGWKGGYGQLVEIQHNGEISKSRFAHLSKILVTSGQLVQRGDVIALSGQTGLATGPHLHFELYQGVKSIDPEKMLHTVGKNVSSLPLFQILVGL